MKRGLKNIQMAFILLVILGLYAFTNQRNHARKITKISYAFTGNENLYTNFESVNKLLIQKNKGPLNASKDKVALHLIEQWLNQDPMLQSATVYMTVDGVLRGLLTQKTPVARVVSDSVFYLDKLGNVMPLSELYSARVPIITGAVTEKELLDLHKLVTFAAQDVFLAKNIVGIHVERERHYLFKCRMDGFDIIWGNAHNLNVKTSKLKAFYNKATQDNTLQNYSFVDVRFKNQVVATKKK